MARDCTPLPDYDDTFCNLNAFGQNPTCNSTSYSDIYCCPFGDGKFIGSDDGFTGIFNTAVPLSSCPQFIFPTLNDDAQPTLKSVINGTAQSPWVKIAFQQYCAGSNFNRDAAATKKTIITTGNVSQPFNDEQCTAVIKSFQFGWGTVNAGNRCTVTILDEKGSTFETWAKRLATGNPEADSKPVTGVYRMKVQFGWYVSGGGPGDVCGQVAGNPNINPPDPSVNHAYTITSPVLWFVPETISVHWEGGRFIYTIEGVDITMRSQQQINSISLGGDGTDPFSAPMYFTDAVQLLGLQSYPPFRVRFLAPGPDKKLVGMQFVKRNGKADDNVCLGPKDVWKPYNRPPLQVIQSWMNEQGVMAKDQTGSVQTADKAVGITMNYDSMQDLTLNNTDNPVDACEDLVQFSVGAAIPRCSENLSDAGTLILMASPIPVCQGNFTETQIDNRLKAVYVVNGGNCVNGSSEILTEDGWKRINEVVKYQYNGRVACINDAHKVTWSKVTNWYRSKLNNRKLVKIHLHNSRQRHGSISGGIFTEDHQVLTDSGYVEIKDLNLIKHKMHSGTSKPSKEIHEAIIGMILGDAHIRRKSYSFNCTHCGEQRNYTEHKAKLLNLEVVDKPDKKYSKVKITSKSTPYWRSLRKLFYPNGTKIINEKILKDFSIISLAYLFMDDGHLKVDKKLAEIAACGFTAEEVDLLINRISELGIKCYRRKNGRYPRIYFNVEQTEVLSEKIAPYIIKSMDYKILQKHKAIDKIDLDLAEEAFYDNFDLIRCKKLEEITKLVYCIDVDKYHNFITHSGVVHNCSPVLAFNPVIKWNFLYALGAGGSSVPTSGIQLRQNSGAIAAQCPVQGGNGIARIAATVSNALALLFPDTVQWIQKTFAIQQMANFITNPIEAELRVQGDPSIWLCSPWAGAGRCVGIIFINPFFLQDIGEGCAQFTQRTDTICNSILTNKGWFVLGVDHQIREGSYVTTLKITLPAPGATLRFAGSPPTNYGAWAPAIPPAGDDDRPSQANYFAPADRFPYGSQSAQGGAESPIDCPVAFVGGGALCDNGLPGTTDPECSSY